MLYLDTIDIPTPTPYDRDDPLKQTENLSYVLLQILAAAKTAAIDLDIIDAVKSLQFNQINIDLGDVKITMTGKSTEIAN
jgi:hypothetical protein